MANNGQNGANSEEKGVETAKTRLKTGITCHWASGPGKAAQDLEGSLPSQTVKRVERGRNTGASLTLLTKTDRKAPSGTSREPLPTT